MTDEITRLQARVKVLEDALRRLLTPFGDDACRLDHHGYCQEHFIEEDCCVAFARAQLAASTPADPVTNAGCCQAVEAERDALRAKLDEAVEAADYLMRVTDDLMQDRFHPLIDVRLMVVANAKIQSIGATRATLAKIKGADHE